MTTDTDRLLSLARECGHWNGVTVEMNDVGLIAFAERIRQDEREKCAVICDEMRDHWCAYKDTAQLNGDIELSIAASGEPRAAEALAHLIRSSGTSKGTAHV